MDVDDDVVDLSVGPSSEKSSSSSHHDRIASNAATTINLDTNARDLRALAQNNSLSITAAPAAAAPAAAQAAAATAPAPASTKSTEDAQSGGKFGQIKFSTINTVMSALYNATRLLSPSIHSRSFGQHADTTFVAPSHRTQVLCRSARYRHYAGQNKWWSFAKQRIRRFGNR